MSAGKQRVLHLLNVAAAMAATGSARVWWDAATAKGVALGALVTTASIGLIGVLVVRATTSGTAKSGAAAFGLVLQFFAVGLVIWGLKPDPLPFGSGVIAVLGATTVSGILDGVKRSKQDDEEERQQAHDDRPQ